MDTTQGLEGNSPQIIREQIEQTRASLGHKLETLESEVRSSVQDASDSVRERIERLKRVFDVSHQIREHPWVTTAAALGIGYLIGATSWNVPRSASSRDQPGTEGRGRGAVDWLQDKLSAETARMKALSYDVGRAVVKGLVLRSLPRHISPIAERLMSISSKQRPERAQWPDQDI